MQDATDIRRECRKAGRASCATSAARLMVLAAAAVGVLSVCAARADSPAAEAGEIVVRVYPNAVVGGDDVVLGDIAEVAGEAAKLVSGWPVATAPPPGGSRSVDLTRVQQLLARRGVNLSRWIFRGATRCAVTRPKGAAARVSARDSAVDAQPRASATAGRLSDTSISTNPAVPNSLEAFLRTHLARRLVSLSGTPVIQFSPAVGKLLALSQPTYRFRIADRGDRLLGLVPLEVTIFERNEVKQVLPVLVQVSLRKQVVVAARSINRSETIESDDLSLLERTFDRVDAIGLADKARLVGQRAKRFIKSGSLLSTRDIEPVPLVTRGRPVTVWVRRGGIVIKGAAKAMSTAGFGETVLLRNAGSRQTFRAIVTGRDTAEVQDSNGELARTVALVKEKR